MKGKGGKAAKTLNGTAKTVAEATERYWDFTRTLPAEPVPQPTPTPAPPTVEPPKAPTFREFAEGGWVKHCEAATLRGKMQPSTVAFYRYALATVLPFIGDVRIDAFSVKVVDDLVTALLKAKKSETTAREYAQVVHRVLRAAVKRGDIPEDPIKGALDLPEARKPEMELSPEEQGAILATFEDRDAAMMQVKGLMAMTWDRHVAFRPLLIAALETGLRKGNLTALRWSNVNLEAGLLEFVTVKTKEKSALPISEELAEVLKALKKGRLRSVGGLVFLDAQGLPWTKQKVQDAFAFAKKLAGITRRLRFHDMRHSFASNLVSAGVSIPIVGKALGHRDLDSTQRYARARNADMVEAVREAMATARKKR